MSLEILEQGLDSTAESNPEGLGALLEDGTNKAAPKVARC